MNVTVAVCTWNRCQLLRSTLEQMTRLVPPAGVQWEVLIVDNNSQDETEQVVASFTDRLPIRRVFEPAAGLSNARNRAVAEAAGEYILWTDDDVLVAPGWLQAYCEAFESHPDAAIFGGPVEPWFEGTPPDWLEQGLSRVSTAFALRDFGSGAFPLTPSRIPFGANYAVRMREQRAVRYNTDLGRNQGEQTILGEETMFIRHLLAAGGTGWWVPEARVRHWIPTSRQTLGYVRTFYEAVGRMQAIRELDPAARSTWRQWGPWLAEWLTAEAALALRWLTSKPSVWLIHFVRASKYRGRLAALGRR